MRLCTVINQLLSTSTFPGLDGLNYCLPLFIQNVSSIKSSVSLWPTMVPTSHHSILRVPAPNCLITNREITAQITERENLIGRAHFVSGLVTGR